MIESIVSVKQMSLKTISVQSRVDFELKMFDDDWLIERFLFACKFDLQKTHDMLIRTSKWRREYNVDTCTESDCLSEIMTGKCRFYGVDKKGRPVCYIFPKLHFCHKTISHEFEKFLIWALEYNSSLLRKEKQTGLVVIDLKGTCLSNLDIGHFSFIAKIFQDYYPELLGNILILNLPIILRGSWEILKKFLKKNVVSKIIFDKKENLTDYIEMSQILPNHEWGRPVSIEMV